MSDHVDPKMLDAMRTNAPEEDVWEVGQPAILVKTRSGSTYTVDTEGNVAGGRLNVSSRLCGAVYRAGGPIRVEEIVIGMRMELTHPEAGKGIITSPVVSIEEPTTHKAEESSDAPT